jgi:2-amino-4-hydroxy-6-hydroxymethyldihydropteridine diphosphokinase
MSIILIAIGANLPSADGRMPLFTCRAAAEALRSLPRVRLQALSRWYRSAPVPPSHQPEYINGVARLEGDAAPPCLLAALQAIEARAGRQRGIANAPRTLDLDIIAIGDLVREGPDPVVPHPRAHHRAFVLVPLADVAPDWRHPVLQRCVRGLIADMPRQTISAA